MSTPHTSRRRLWPLRFIGVEALGGIVLLAAAALALACANSPLAHAYESLWRQRLSLGMPLLAAGDLRFWVNDGLMSIFFLLVGLEIRRELHDGTLSDPRVATLPIIAAAGGVVVPALSYMLVARGPQVGRGWAIPTATDIAFAVGVLSLIGRVPTVLRMLLLTLAIADDIAAILIIAIFYSGGLVAAQLLLVAAGIALVLLLQALGVRSALAYVFPGAVLWLGMLQAGVHPALTGVVLGLLTPVTAGFGPGARQRARKWRSPSVANVTLSPRSLSGTPVVRVEAMLHPYVAFGIMPLFAFANAGVRLEGLDFSAGPPLEVIMGIVLALVLGKPAGIVLAALAAVRLKVAELPPGVRWSQLMLLGVVAGIGFTMSIFIANLAFEEPALLVAAKFAVLAGSAIAATLATTLGRLSSLAQPTPKA
ncbi:MAG TPA: Na+/H+ antiporter NhaA [Steroidobacteraceae bacterium]|nr:Na+/H+ antiporter NhaA [Steroidobacteraceae bacterium]